MLGDDTLSSGSTLDMAAERRGYRRTGAFEHAQGCQIFERIVRNGLRGEDTIEHQRRVVGNYNRVTILRRFDGAVGADGSAGAGPVDGHDWNLE